MSALSPWNKEDITSHKRFDDLISKNVDWKVSTAELIQVYRSLVWFAGLKDKIEKSQAEIKSVTVLDASKAEAEKKIKKERKPRKVAPAAGE
jgi:hypothetical protein